MFGCWLMRSASSRAICSTTSFSRVPPGPMAPGSSPPWPGSSATMMSRSVLPAGGNGLSGAGLLTADALAMGGLAVLLAGRPVCLAISSPSASGPAAETVAGADSGVKVLSRRGWLWGLPASRSAISASSGSATCVGYRSNTRRYW